MLAGSRSSSGTMSAQIHRRPQPSHPRQTRSCGRRVSRVNTSLRQSAHNGAEVKSSDATSTMSGRRISEAEAVEAYTVPVPKLSKAFPTSDVVNRTAIECTGSDLPVCSCWETPPRDPSTSSSTLVYLTRCCGREVCLDVPVCI